MNTQARIVKRSPLGYLFFGYFLLTIGIFGLPLCYILSTIFIISGQVFHSQRLKRIGAKSMKLALNVLLGINFWMKLKIEINNQDSRPLMIVCNHRSILDIFLLLSQWGNLRVLAKSSLFKVPFLAPMMYVTRQIKIQRKDQKSYFKAVEKIKKGLGAGDPIAIFPEMTRCEEGSTKLGRFDVTAFWLARTENAFILPVVFWNTDKIWPKHTCRFSWKPTAIVKSLDLIDTRLYSSSQELKSDVHNLIQNEVNEFARLEKNESPSSFTILNKAEN